MRLSFHQPTTVIVALSLAVSSCSAFAASDGSSYSLSRVNGDPLPATLYEINTQGGHHMVYQVLRAKLSLKAFGRFLLETEGRRVWDGIPNDSVLTGTASGDFVQTDTTVVTRYTDLNGAFIEDTYHIFENGRVLRGLTGDFAPAVYEYVRD